MSLKELQRKGLGLGSVAQTRATNPASILRVGGWHWLLAFGGSTPTSPPGFVLLKDTRCAFPLSLPVIHTSQ